LLRQGLVVGLAAFSRLLGWLLSKYHDYMVAFLTGLMLGSLRKVWPFKETLESMVGSGGKVIPIVQKNILPAQWTGEVTFAICLGLFGFAVVLILDRMASGE
jgi:putative membrane protein